MSFDVPTAAADDERSHCAHCGFDRRCVRAAAAFTPANQAVVRRELYDDVAYAAALHPRTSLRMPVGHAYRKRLELDDLHGCTRAGSELLVVSEKLPLALIEFVQVAELVGIHIHAQSRPIDLAPARTSSNRQLFGQEVLEHDRCGLLRPVDHIRQSQKQMVRGRGADPELAMRMLADADAIQMCEMRKRMKSAKGAHPIIAEAEHVDRLRGDRCA